MGTGIDADFIEGIGKLSGEFVVILNIDRVFASDDLLQLGSVAKAAEMMSKEDEKEEAEA